MADSDLPGLSSLAGASLAAGDLFHVVDVSDTAFAADGTDKKIPASELVTGLSAQGLATDAEVASAVATHEADTTAVHGIADTSALLDTADIGVSVQGYDGDLAAIAALTPTNDDIIQRKAGAWTNRTLAQLKTDLALTASNISDFNEAAQDAVGGSLTDSSRIDFTYNDGANTITADIVTNSVGDSYLRQGAATSVIGRSAGSTGNVADIAASSDSTWLGRTSGTLSFSSPPGRLVSRQVLTAGTTTYTKPAGVTTIVVRMVGPGGGGGGADGGSSQCGVGGGGGAGAYIEKFYTGLTSSSQAITVAIGTGGNGATAGNNSGSAGSASTVFDSGATFGSTLTAPAGNGGGSMAAGTAVTVASGAAGGSTPTGGDIAFRGQMGTPGYRFSASAYSAGIGASSPFGSCPSSRITGNDGAGVAAVGYGAGGGGGASTTTTDRGGGNGADGVIIVDEYS